MAVKFVFKEVMEDNNSITETQKTLTFKYNDVPLSDVLQGIAEFLNGCGYVIKGNLIVDDEE